MHSIKILHCADLHLGAEQSSIGEKARLRKEEVLMTFNNIISLCQKENVELLLIAGDLFESNNVNPTIIDTVKKAFAEIPNTIVAIAPGNHDHIAIDSPYLDENWGKNVFIFTSELQRIKFQNRGIRLWGGAFTTTYMVMPILKNAVVPDDDFINICVLHGDLVTEKQQTNYNPIFTSQIASSKMDYVALGHIHKRTEILRAENTYYAYSGCVEGQGFDELGEKGVYMGTVSKGSCNLSFVPICTRMYLETSVDITGATNNNEIADIVLKSLKNNYGEDFKNHLYKIILEGEIDVNFNIDCVAIAFRLSSQVYYSKIKDNTHIAIDIKALALETSLKGIFTKKMLDKIDELVKAGDNETAEQYKNSLYIGLKAFDSEVKYNEN